MFRITRCGGVILINKKVFPLIIETILSSCDKDGKINFAPVGVHIPDDTPQLSEADEFELFLYSGSRTYSNLTEIPEGVINFTDDILSFVEAAVCSPHFPEAQSQFIRPPRMAAAKTVWEFVITSFDQSTEPARIVGKVLLRKEIAGFFGFCRAGNVILEAAILATRLPWVQESKITGAWPQWREIVAKTGGKREKKAFQKLNQFFIKMGISIPDYMPEENFGCTDDCI